MKRKPIPECSNFELLDLIYTGIARSTKREAEQELNSRNLTPEKREELEQEYVRFKKNQKARKNEPLTHEEWWSFFLLPFFTPRPLYRDDHFTIAEMNRFEKYGFDKKLKEAQMVKTLGLLFWYLVFIIGFLLVMYLHLEPTDNH